MVKTPPSQGLFAKAESLACVVPVVVVPTALRFWACCVVGQSPDKIRKGEASAGIVAERRGWLAKLRSEDGCCHSNACFWPFTLVPGAPGDETSRNNNTITVPPTHNTSSSHALNCTSRVFSSSLPSLPHDTTFLAFPSIESIVPFLHTALIVARLLDRDAIDLQLPLAIACAAPILFSHLSAAQSTSLSLVSTAVRGPYYSPLGPFPVKETRAEPQQHGPFQEVAQSRADYRVYSRYVVPA